MAMRYNNQSNKFIIAEANNAQQELLNKIDGPVNKALLDTGIIKKFILLV